VHLNWKLAVKLDARGSPCDRRRSRDKNDDKDKDKDPSAQPQPVPSEPSLDTETEDETAEIVIPISQAEPGSVWSSTARRS